MKSESEYIDAVLDLFEAESKDSRQLLSLTEQAVAAHPHSVELWLRRGDALILTTDYSDGHAQLALDAYRRAAEIDPRSIEAWNEIGFVLDSFEDDFTGAEEAFRKALALGGNADTYYGLARVLAQQGRIDEALQLIDLQNCPFAEDAEISKLRDEINDGTWFDDADSRDSDSV